MNHIRYELALMRRDDCSVKPPTSSPPSDVRATPPAQAAAAPVAGSRATRIPPTHGEGTLMEGFDPTTSFGYETSKRYDAARDAR